LKFTVILIDKNIRCEFDLRRIKMTVSSVGEGFPYRGKRYTVGQRFINATVFRMGAKPSLFVRTPDGLVGRLINSGDDAVIVGGRVNVKLVAFSAADFVGKARPYVEFEIDRSGSSNPPVPPPMKEDLLGCGMELSGKIMRHGLNGARQMDAKRWLTRVIIAIDQYLEEIEPGWTTELFNQRGYYLNLARLSRDIRVRIGLEPFIIEIPSPGGEISPAGIDRPKIDLFKGKDLSFLYRKCRRANEILRLAGVWVWQFEEVRQMRHLTEWLAYLVKGTRGNVRTEYEETADWPPSLVNEHKIYLAGILEKLNAAFSG
jgi:hypothetical protein